MDTLASYTPADSFWAVSAATGITPTFFVADGTGTGLVQMLHVPAPPALLNSTYTLGIAGTTGATSLDNHDVWDLAIGSLVALPWCSRRLRCPPALCMCRTWALSPCPTASR